VVGTMQFERLSHAVYLHRMSYGHLESNKRVYRIMHEGKICWKIFSHIISINMGNSLYKKKKKAVPECVSNKQSFPSKTKQNN